jgi:hypothetical protein
VWRCADQLKGDHATRRAYSQIDKSCVPVTYSPARQSLVPTEPPHAIAAPPVTFSTSSGHHALTIPRHPATSHSATAKRLAITDEASPFALRSTRNRPRRAVRRGAAWPAERSSSWLVVREAVSRWQVAHRRAVMVAKRRRHCPQEHGGVAQRAPAGAWWPRRCGCRPCLRQRVGVLGQRPESFVWCGCPSITRACPSGRCPVSGAGF